MSDRETLIELIGEMPRVYYFALHQNNGKTYEEILADHLIANGVTVQRHGRWLDNAIALAEKCSICGEGVYWDDGNYHRYPYCPNCGADMRGE